MLDLDHYLPNSPYNVNLKAKLRALSARLDEVGNNFNLEEEDKELLIEAFYHYRQFHTHRGSYTHREPYTSFDCISKYVIKDIKNGKMPSTWDVQYFINTCIETKIENMFIGRLPYKNFKIEHPHIIAYGFVDWLNILLEHEDIFNKVALTIQKYFSDYFDDKYIIKFSAADDRKLSRFADKPIFKINLMIGNRKEEYYSNILLTGTNYPFKLFFCGEYSDMYDKDYNIEKPEDWKKYVFNLIGRIDKKLIKHVTSKLERKIDELERKIEELELAPNVGPNPVIANLIDKYQKEERKETLEAQRIFLMDHQNHYDRLLEKINKIMKDKWGFDLAIKLMKTYDNHIGMPNERIRFNLKTEWSSCDIILFGLDYPYQVYLEEDETTVEIQDEREWEKISVYFVTHPPKHLRERSLN